MCAESCKEWQHRSTEEMFLSVGARIGYFQGDVKKLVDDIATLRPTLFIGTHLWHCRRCCQTEIDKAQGNSAATAIKVEREVSLQSLWAMTHTSVCFGARSLFSLTLGECMQACPGCLTGYTTASSPSWRRRAAWRPSSSTGATASRARSSGRMSARTRCGSALRTLPAAAPWQSSRCRCLQPLRSSCHEPDAASV